MFRLSSLYYCLFFQLKERSGEQGQSHRQGHKCDEKIEEPCLGPPGKDTDKPLEGWGRELSKVDHGAQKGCSFHRFSRRGALRGFEKKQRVNGPVRKTYEKRCRKNSHGYGKPGQDEKTRTRVARKRFPMIIIGCRIVGLAIVSDEVFYERIGTRRVLGWIGEIQDVLDLAVWETDFVLPAL